MTKYFLGLFIIVLLLSCKKGENDPFFSLRTRKARLVNTWQLMEFSGTFDEDYTLYENSVQTQINYNGNREIRIITDKDTTLYDTVYYRIEYTFNKDYTYSRKKTETSPEDPELNDYMVEEGRWDFLSKSKPDQFKNKERIILTPIRYYNDIENYQLEYTSYVWILTKLSEKELKVSVENEYNNYVSGYSGTQSIDYLFESE